MEMKMLGSLIHIFTTNIYSCYQWVWKIWIMCRKSEG